MLLAALIWLEIGVRCGVGWGEGLVGEDHVGDDVYAIESDTGLDEGSWGDKVSESGNSAGLEWGGTLDQVYGARVFGGNLDASSNEMNASNPNNQNQNPADARSDGGDSSSSRKSSRTAGKGTTLQVLKALNVSVQEVSFALKKVEEALRINAAVGHRSRRRGCRTP